MTVDWTIHASDVGLLGSGLVAFVVMFLKIRDVLRDVIRSVGTADPPTGLIGDVKHLAKEQQLHREWLIRWGLDRHAASASGNDLHEPQTRRPLG